jgi:hypothetical protein
VKKTWWIEALKDLTFHRRTPRVAGEVFQEPIPIAAQMIHKKLAKRTSDPAATPTVAPATAPDVHDVVESEPDQPSLDVAQESDALPEADPVEHEAEVVVDSASGQVAAPAEPVSTRRGRRKGKPETPGDAD